MRFSALFILSALLPAVIAQAGVPACSPAEDSLHASTDACVTGHVFDIVTVAGGTRFLDLCSPDTPDNACHFSIVSYRKDSRQVGNLESLRGKDISIRGALLSHDQRLVLILSDQRQLHGGAPRFTPDARLVHGLSTEGHDTDQNDELRVNFHHHGRKLEKE
jgi:hypothetical protein